MQMALLEAFGEFGFFISDGETQLFKTDVER